MKHRSRRVLLYFLLRAVIFLIQRLPRRVALGLARGVGRVAYYLVARHRKRVLAHLKFAWKGEKSETQIRALAKRVFENLAMTTVDVILFPRLTRDTLRDWVIYDDEFARMNRILDEGQGVLVVTAHLGNWELLAATFGVMGYDGAVVGRRIYYEPYNRILIKLREAVRVRTIYRDSPPKEILQVLKNNQILGMLSDQDVDSVEGIYVDFFGHPAYTPTAPVRVAMAARTVILPAFVIREGERYRLVMEEPIAPVPVRGSKEETVREFTERWCAVVERYIRQYPDQWVWMHDRWKTRLEATFYSLKRRAAGSVMEAEAETL